MSGPPFPRLTPGSSSGAIGSFIIGVSPIGTVSSFDIWSTVISQYANSPTLTALITDFDAYIDQTADLEAFFDLIWNVDTAVGYGLDVWGRIVNVSRTINLGIQGAFFGFQEAGDAEGFNQEPFFSTSPITVNFDLADDAYRTLIFTKALANISDGSIPSINQMLLNLFPGRGNCYVIDNGDMTMVFRFEFGLSPVELAILGQSGVLPKPTGVDFSISHL